MRRHFRRLRSRKGLCLPEILVSCLIGLIGIGAILGSFLSGRLASTGAKHWTQAMNVARSRMEYLKSMRYADLSAMPSVTTEPSVPLDERDAGNSIECVRTTALTPDDTGGGITITVLVCWSEKTAGAGLTPWTYTLKTWVSATGPPPGI
jgi:Tfp pilus assembly protein PilV